MFYFFFFFKQKTAYEMRISDWSSDVCSSDLFTSPIRCYSYLVVHRSLVRAFGLGPGKLTDDEMATIERTGEHISMTERRAMEAERDTIDRYVAAFLAQHGGEVMEARITGVTNFGFFATVAGIGGDGLVPVSPLGGG